MSDRKKGVPEQILEQGMKAASRAASSSTNVANADQVASIPLRSAFVPSRPMSPM
mgnify:CR=1 FL=1